MSDTPKSSARRYTLTHAQGDNPHFSTWLDDIEECKAYVRALGKPVRIYDRQEDARGTLYPSGSFRWNPR